MKQLFLWLITSLVMISLALSMDLRSEQPASANSGPQVAARQISIQPSGDEFIDAVNRARSNYGVSLIVKDSQLAKIAGFRAEDMKSRRYYAHTTPDGLTYAAYFENQVGNSCENLNLTESTSFSATINDWLDSLSHRDCLLDSRFKHAGYAHTEAFDQSLSVLILSD